MGYGEARGAGPKHLALRYRDGHRRGRHGEQRGVRHFDHIHHHREAHGPAAVIVGTEPRVRILLPLEQVLGQPAIGLIPLDEVRSRGIAHGIDFERLPGDADFDPLSPENVHQFGRPGHVPLDRDDVAIWGLRLPILDRVPGLHIEILEHRGREHRRQLERREHARLHVVGVGAAGEFGRVVLADRDPAIPLTFLRATPSAGHEARGGRDRPHGRRRRGGRDRRHRAGC